MLTLIVGCGANGGTGCGGPQKSSENSTEPGGANAIGGANGSDVDAAQRVVLDLAENVLRGHPEYLESAIDWKELESNVRQRKELLREMDSPEFNAEMRKGLKTFFSLGPGGKVDNVRFSTRAKVVGGGFVRVFLFDGEPNVAGTINLTFIVRRDPADKAWRIVYVDFFQYGRWAIFSEAERRKVYRQRILADY
jgi:hypothetical protein